MSHAYIWCELFNDAGVVFVIVLACIECTYRGCYIQAKQSFVSVNT
jgi:hypothetical protein